MPTAPLRGELYAKDTETGLEAHFFVIKMFYCIPKRIPPPSAALLCVDAENWRPAYLWGRAPVCSVDMAAAAAEELRRCKRCDRDLPLTMFLKGPRRFVCKTHMREMIKRAAPPLSADERAARKIWVCSYKDVKSLRGDTAAINLTHADIKAVLERAGQQPTSYRDVFILPRVPTDPLTASNAVLSGHSTRRYLLTLWRKRRDVEAYARAVQSLGNDPLL